MIGEITLVSSTSAVECIHLPLADLFELYESLTILVERRNGNGNRPGT